MSRTVKRDTAVKVTLVIGGKRFGIKKTVIAVHRLYGEYLETAGQLFTYAAMVGDLQEEAVAANEKRKEQIIEEIQEKTSEIEEFSRNKIDALLRIIRIICETNGYDFDEQWWLTNAEQADLQWFIVETIRKDVSDKKKEEQKDG